MTSTILKATPSEIRICDQYNRLICTHRRSYKDFPLYITTDEHMPPEHLYYQEINSKDGNYYRRWASVFGSSMSELIDRILKSSKHEEQTFNACAGILHRVKAIPKGIAEEASRKCIEMNSCRYSTYRQVLKKMECDEHTDRKNKIITTNLQRIKIFLWTNSIRCVCPAWQKLLKTNL